MKKYLNLVFIIVIAAFIVQIGFEAAIYSENKEVFLDTTLPKSLAIAGGLKMYLEDGSGEGHSVFHHALRQMGESFEIYENALKYNILWHKTGFFSKCEYMPSVALDYVSARYNEFADKMWAGEELELDEFHFLKEVEAAMRAYYESLTNSDGSLKKDAFNKDYFAEKTDELTYQLVGKDTSYLHPEY
ncbi:MAG: hypothetical protein IJN84_01755 [Clostridia bacterium]|nr:hypothetical protein [Clostridia bacterium]